VLYYVVLLLASPFFFMPISIASSIRHLDWDEEHFLVQVAIL
jgi:hypothetical protein